MLNNYKTYITQTILIIYINTVWFFANAVATPFPYENSSSVWDKDPALLLKTNIVGSNSLRSNIMKTFFGDWLVNKSWNAMEYIKNLINIALSLVWFIALCMIIYGFFMIFFSKEEEWLKMAKSIVKWSVTAIILIWLSWTIVSLMFWWVSLLRTT